MLEVLDEESRIQGKGDDDIVDVLAKYRRFSEAGNWMRQRKSGRYGSVSLKSI